MEILAGSSRSTYDISLLQFLLSPDVETGTIFLKKREERS